MFWKGLFNFLKVLGAIIVFVLLLPVSLALILFLLLIVIFRYIYFAFDKLLNLLYSLLDKLYNFVLSHAKSWCLLPFNLFLKIAFNLSITEGSNKYSNIKQNTFGKKQLNEYDDVDIETYE